MNLRLEAASTKILPGLAELLADLGEGVRGFGGTAVPRGALTLDGYLQRCQAMSDAANLPADHIPRTIFWLVDQAGYVIGMVRMWHSLNASLQDRSGHLSYYIRRDKRGRGYAREALRLALLELGKVGVKNALLIADLDHIASTKVIRANGGTLASVGRGADGKEFGRYWIALSADEQD